MEWKKPTKKDYEAARKRIEKMTTDPEERRILGIFANRYLENDGK